MPCLHFVRVGPLQKRDDGRYHVTDTDAATSERKGLWTTLVKGEMECHGRQHVTLDGDDDDDDNDDDDEDDDDDDR
ncbi:hypothetical protein PoB_007269100 [Plakobranchus ocellatus]|uniref:Uncharacterized protein n=1 Tax=Plakobranchus ocellatus TaxID=259542 RepID=A0AAV4DQQ0_9GAST|nr:hypothetical protein PoB_007269100 [Plakobranchus ocellatus]